MNIFKYAGTNYASITTRPFKLRLNSEIRCTAYRPDLHYCQVKKENSFKRIRF